MVFLLKTCSRFSMPFYLGFRAKYEQHRIHGTPLYSCSNWLYLVCMCACRLLVWMDMGRFKLEKNSLNTCTEGRDRTRNIAHRSRTQLRCGNISYKHETTFRTVMYAGADGLFFLIWYFFLCISVAVFMLFKDEFRHHIWTFDSEVSHCVKII